MILSVALSNAAVAAEWSWQPGVSSSIRYSDNRGFQETNKRSNGILDVSPSLDLRARSDRWDTGVSGRFTRQTNTNRDFDDSNLIHIGMDGAYLFPTHQFDVSGTFNRTTTLSVDENDPDLGLVTRDIDRTSLSIGPGWSWSVTPKLSLSARYNFRETTINRNTANLSDFALHSGDLSGTYQWNQQLLLQLNASVSRFKVLDSDFTSDTGSIRPGIQYQLSPVSSVSISAGIRRTRREQDTVICQVLLPGFGCAVFAPAEVATTDTGLVVNSAYSRRFEAGAIQISASRSLSASTVGDQVETDTASVTVSRLFSQRLTGNLGFQLLRGRTDGDTQTTADRDFYSIEPSISWRASPRLTVTARYSFRKINRLDTDTRASANDVNLTLTYRWPRIAVSR